MTYLLIQNKTALDMASASGFTEIVKILLDHGAIVNKSEVCIFKNILLYNSNNSLMFVILFDFIVFAGCTY